MNVCFDSSITEQEQKHILSWIKKNHPVLPQTIVLDCGEYVLLVVTDSSIEGSYYKVKKPTEIKITQY